MASIVGTIPKPVRSVEGVLKVGDTRVSLDTVVYHFNNGEDAAEIQDQYERRQLAAWKKMLVDGEQFQVAPNLNAAILPFLVEEERFTVTVFIPRPTNKW